MAPTGPLGRLLALGQKQVVTWLVDPAMLDEARQMRGRLPGGRRQQRQQARHRREGRRELAASLRRHPREEPGRPAPVRRPGRGRPDRGGGADCSDLVGQSRAATEQYNLGGAQSFNSGLWLENGSVTSRNLAAASTGYAGARSDDTTLVSSSSWAAADRPNLAPSPVYDVLTPEGPVKSVRTVIADSSLTAGGPDPADASSPLQVRQRFAAETGLLASTGKGPISVVALPPRGWDADGLATRAAGAGPQHSRGSRRSTLNDVNARDPETSRQQGSRPAARPAATPAGALTSAQLDQIRRLSTTTGTFVSLLSNIEQADENLRRALLRSGSYGWRGFGDESQRFLSYEQGGVTSQLNKVHLVTNAAGERGQHPAIKVNLSGSKGQFPLTVENGLDVSIRVGVTVSSPNRTDLRIQPITLRLVPPHQKATFQIKASAEQNGLIRAEAEVVTAQQTRVGRPQELVIQAAQYGSVGWILVGAACALLFGTSAVRIYRRIRSEKRNPTPSAPGPDPLHPAPLDPPGPAEPATDRSSHRPMNCSRGSRSTPEPNGHAQESLKEGVGTKDG